MQQLTVFECQVALIIWKMLPDAATQSRTELHGACKKNVIKLGGACKKNVLKLQKSETSAWRK